MKKRVALYLRVSTNNGHQTVENQRRDLEAAVERPEVGLILRLEAACVIGIVGYRCFVRSFIAG
jgi:hypothetical protein